MKALSMYKISQNMIHLPMESHLVDIGDLIWLLVLIDFDLGSELPDSAVLSVFGSSIQIISSFVEDEWAVDAEDQDCVTFLTTFYKRKIRLNAAYGKKWNFAITNIQRRI
ncbi:hypothetical protein T05_11580 [Trichinella murrelli]|uniref:Uncharacterized protein n=1 Tax=Trichinella murrelli TaxID=144512 RepID=A0A0V0UBY0_9BILA|nr:hypothetical protein T05_11580 [Trichinella murrelli]